MRGSVCALTSKASCNLSHILLHPSLLSLHKSTVSVYKADILPQRNCFLPFTFQNALPVERFTRLSNVYAYANFAFYFAFTLLLYIRCMSYQASLCLKLHIALHLFIKNCFTLNLFFNALHHLFLVTYLHKRV